MDPACVSKPSTHCFNHHHHHRRRRRRRHGHHHHHHPHHHHHGHHYLFLCPHNRLHHHHNHRHVCPNLPSSTRSQEEPPVSLVSRNDDVHAETSQYPEPEAPDSALPLLLEEEEEDEPVFVLTDEWRDFFAKSEAKRKLEKKLAKKAKKALNHES